AHHLAHGDVPHDGRHRRGQRRDCRRCEQAGRIAMEMIILSDLFDQDPPFVGDRLYIITSSPPPSASSSLTIRAKFKGAVFFYATTKLGALVDPISPVISAVRSLLFEGIISSPSFSSHVSITRRP
ncbi:hypothetical protein HC823_00550, partial [Candidatus Gracilibacteria bacterium]|nr:hypothetical protein [Candidatus Gracilibacteria bacterium]